MVKIVDGTWSIYGSVIEMRQGDKTWLGIVLDSLWQLVAIRTKIDMWTYSHDVSLDTAGIDWRIVRYGY